MVASNPASIRAVRNNNPGNLEKGQPWQGLMPVSVMTPAQLAEPRFCVFEGPEWGFRAMILTLMTYSNRFAKAGKPFCVRTIITSWAPPPENDTEKYIEDVCGRTGFTDMQVLQPTVSVLGLLVKAISTHEVGEWAFNDADIDRALILAGTRPA